MPDWQRSRMSCQWSCRVKAYTEYIIRFIPANYDWEAHGTTTLLVCFALILCECMIQKCDIYATVAIQCRSCLHFDFQCICTKELIPKSLMHAELGRMLGRRLEASLFLYIPRIPVDKVLVLDDNHSHTTCFMHELKRMLIYCYRL